MRSKYNLKLSIASVQVASKLGLLDAYGWLRSHLVESSAAIVLYHSLGKSESGTSRPTREDFEEQIRFLISRYRIVSLNRLIRTLREGEPIPVKTIAITFDDGYKDNYLNAFPILKEYNIPAIIFLTTGCVDTGDLFWWEKINYGLSNTPLEAVKSDELGLYILRTVDQRSFAAYAIQERLKNMPETKKNVLIESLLRKLKINIPFKLARELVLSWDEIREMAKSGITFGAHTLTHPILTSVPLDEARRQIVESKKRIEEKLDGPVTSFAYPVGRPGDYNDSIKKIVEDSGFECAVTATPAKLAGRDADLYALGRVPSGWDASTLQLCICGLYPDLASSVIGSPKK